MSCLLRAIVFIGALTSQVSLGAQSLDGTWSGKTSCPLGDLEFTLKIKGETGVLQHGGYGPQKLRPLTVPIKVRMDKGIKGELVYLWSAEPGYQGPFGQVSGLLSPDRKAITVQKGVSMTGDCNSLRLSKETTAADAREVAAQWRGRPVCSIKEYPKVFDSDRRCRIPWGKDRDSGMYKGCLLACAESESRKDICLKRCDCSVDEFNRRELDITVTFKPEWKTIGPEIANYCAPMHR